MAITNLVGKTSTGQGVLGEINSDILIWQLSENPKQNHDLPTEEARATLANGAQFCASSKQISV